MKKEVWDLNIAALTGLAEHGDAEAENELGNRYHNAQGVPQSPFEAIKCWKRASGRNDQTSLMRGAALSLKALAAGSRLPVHKAIPIRRPWLSRDANGHEHV